MAVTELPRIFGPNTRLIITTAAGAIAMAMFNEISLDETPDTKDADVAASRDKLKGFTKDKAKLTCKSLRGLNLCYSDLPAQRQRVTGIEFQTLDEDGAVIADAEDFPNLIRSADNPGGYILWAVTEKKGKQDDGPGDVELVLESGIVNARE